MFTAEIQRTYVDYARDITGAGAVHFTVTVFSVGMARSPQAALRIATERANAEESNDRTAILYDERRLMNGRTLN